MPLPAVPRSVLFPGQLPRSSNGELRPALQPGRPYLTVHHTGAGRWADPGDSAIEIRGIQDWALNRRVPPTPWEYNYVVDSEGVAWEYAGMFRAAHSAGENDLAIGVLLLGNFALERPTPAMLERLRILRYELVADGCLAADHSMRRHRDMPGAETSCPMLTEAEWQLATTPWSPPPPLPPPTVEDAMPRFIGRRAVDNAEFPFVIGDGSEDGRLLTAGQAERLVNAYAAAGAPLLDAASAINGDRVEVRRLAQVTRRRGIAALLGAAADDVG